MGSTFDLQAELSTNSIGLQRLSCGSAVHFNSHIVWSSGISAIYVSCCLAKQALNRHYSGACRQILTSLSVDYPARYSLTVLPQRISKVLSICHR